MSSEEKVTTLATLRQIIPSQPDVYAIYKNSDGELRRLPVIAWGLWMEWDLLESGRSSERLTSGPLVHEFSNGLVPAKNIGTPDGYLYEGMCIGEFLQSADGSFEEDNGKMPRPSIEKIREILARLAESKDQQAMQRAAGEGK